MYCLEIFVHSRKSAHITKCPSHLTKRNYKHAMSFATFLRLYFIVHTQECVIKKLRDG